MTRIVHEPENLDYTSSSGDKAIIPDVIPTPEGAVITSPSISALGEASKRKLIIFWTPKLEVEDWTWGLGAEPFELCEYSNCEFSKDKSRVAEADMLLFYRREKPHFPALRLPHQLYVHFSREPPNQVTGGFHLYSDYINMTISYRYDGNIAIPYFEAVSYDTEQEPYTPRIAFRNKTKNVVWMSSNCRPASKRDVYVDELRKYIDVDVYGRCGNYTCDIKQGSLYRHCFEMFEKVYKFYLSFENEICKDYYTEKLLNPLTHELIPIVLGGADYDRYMPEHSLINVLDFSSPKQLAHFLKSMTEEQYYEYFKWKSRYQLLPPAAQCRLCEFLHNSSYARGERISPPYTDNYTAWMYDSCNNSLIDKMQETW